jgi:glycosyltransferase involved in cell wall biosynthesis
MRRRVTDDRQPEGARRRLSLLAELWRAEGPASVVDRARDHAAAARQRCRFRRVDLAAVPAVSVLRVAASPPVPWLGGVQALLGATIREQQRHGDTALVYPWRGGLRLEVVAGPRRFAAQLASGAPVAAGGSERWADGLQRSADGGEGWARYDRWVDGIERAAAAAGARLLHVEGAAGLPLSGLTTLARQRPLVLSLHDFALFCPRPNLYDERRDAACGYCADGATCERTLAAAGHPAAGDAGPWRERGAELLAASRCVVYPSLFLRDAHERLFGSAGAETRVIAPGIEHARMSPWRWPWTARSAAPRIAFIGGGSPHKGSALLAAAIAEWTRRGLPGVRWEVLGGGGADQLHGLRRLPGVRVRGYYRHGSLGALLRRRRVELALLLPRVAESFSLVLSECLAAGVPVMATAQGALAERLEAGGGHLLPEHATTDELVAALADWTSGRLAMPAPPPVPTTGGAAAALAGLYDELAAKAGG